MTAHRPVLQGQRALVVGIGWGLVETVINPLMTSLYPRDKASRLNAVHAWWPGGLVIGGLLGVAMTAVGLGWQAKLAFIALPGILVAILCMGVRFPPTERAAAGVSMGQMFRELANPLFIILFLSMFLGDGGPGLSSRPFAEATQATIDSEVARLLRDAEQSAVELIRAHRAELGQLVELLLDQETVDGAAVYRIVGKPVPGRRPEEIAIAPRAGSRSGAARNGSEPARHPDPGHRPGSGPATSAT